MQNKILIISSILLAAKQFYDLQIISNITKFLPVYMVFLILAYAFILFLISIHVDYPEIKKELIKAYNKKSNSEKIAKFLFGACCIATGQVLLFILFALAMIIDSYNNLWMKMITVEDAGK